MTTLIILLASGATVRGQERVELRNWYDQITQTSSVSEDDEAYWFEITQKCRKQFSSRVAGESPATQVRYFVDQFGADGNGQSDFRWVLSDYDMTVPYSSYNPWLDKAPLETRDRCLLLCESISRRCLKDREFLERYYQFVVWTERLFGNASKGILDQKVQHGLPVAALVYEYPERPDYYWYYARNYVLLAYAFSREDLLNDCDPEQLHEGFERFQEWFLRHEGAFALSPTGDRWEPLKAEAPVSPEFKYISIPATPFPNWKGRKPMKASWLRKIH
ncbi:MAG: hypothetical protein KDA88_02750 [Planctomycetaceae bacterium]|nr:hypothetical protein [Planctomycetaceae bacterium]